MDDVTADSADRERGELPDHVGTGARPTADSLNPQAGSHAITSDPRELRAALRAGERTWQRFPYYEARYGERGRRFTASDSAWIATLPGRPQAAVNRQVLWLGTLLASRGMPRWLLEVHLRHLREELAVAVPERRAAYDALGRAADLLRDLRRRYLRDEAFESLNADFEAQVGPAWRARLPETGRLLAAAVVDEHDGIEAAVSSLEPWLTDSERFPPDWVEAVRATLDKSRVLALGEVPRDRRDNADLR
jgi:hypothetical protein